MTRAKRAAEPPPRRAQGLLHAMAVRWWLFLDWLMRLMGVQDRATRQRLQELKVLMKQATTYDEWLTHAHEHDRLAGHEEWRNEPSSDDYDFDQVRKQLTLLREARASGNLWMLIMQVRSSLARNFADIANPQLFRHSLVGTKRLIEEYIDEMDAALQTIFTSNALPLKERIELCASLRRVYGRSALLLSGGATLGMYHLGVLKTLFEQKLLPRVFSGSSAGSLMASLVCCKTDEELPQFLDPTNINLNAIERRGDGVAQRRIRRLLKTGYIFDVEVLQEAIRANDGDLTFLEAYNRTRRVLNITVSANNAVEMPRLLNYLTAPNVLVWSAASASCAIPGLYQPVPLMAKNKRGEIVPWNPNGPPWVDGSVQSDLPKRRLAEMFNINHFIVSQVNPHIAPFLSNRPPPNTKLRRLTQFAISTLRVETSHWLDQALNMDVLPSSLRKVALWTRALLDQTYTGDITIVPAVKLSDYASIMANPDVPSVRRKMVDTEHACWEQLAMIRMHCRLEHTLDHMLYQLRVQMLNTIGRPYRATDFALGVPVEPNDDEEEAEEGEEESVRFHRSVSMGAALYAAKSKSMRP